MASKVYLSEIRNTRDLARSVPEGEEVQVERSRPIIERPVLERPIVERPAPKTTMVQPLTIEDIVFGQRDPRFYGLFPVVPRRLLW